MDKTKIIMVLLILAIVFSVMSIIISFNATDIFSSKKSSAWGNSNSGAVGNVVFFVEENNAEDSG